MTEGLLLGGGGGGGGCPVRICLVYIGSFTYNKHDYYGAGWNLVVVVVGCVLVVCCAVVVGVVAAADCVVVVGVVVCALAHFPSLTETNSFLYSFLYPPQTKFGGYIGITLSVFPSICPSVQSKLNLDHNFLTKGDRALILHKCIPCDKTFLVIPKFLTLWPWSWLLTYV